MVAAQEELAAFAVRIYLEDRGASQALADTCSERQVEEAFPSCQDEVAEAEAEAGEAAEPRSGPRPTR